MMGIAIYRSHVFGSNECVRVYGVLKVTIKRHSDGKNTNVSQVKIFGRLFVFNSNIGKN